MMGHRPDEQAALFYEFSLERHVPPNHLLRSIDRFVELDGLRRELSAFYSTIGRPSIAPELMIRMLLVGYCFGIGAALVRRGSPRSGIPLVLPPWARG
jgi:transposase